MESISQAPSVRAWQTEVSEGNINLQITREPCSSEVIVQKLSEVKGPLDIYSWYDSSRGMPVSGAVFLKEQLFEPLYTAKQDVKCYPYSLTGWDLNKRVSELPSSTKLGDAINRINRSAFECINASSFFQYCKDVSSKISLYTWVSQELPKKKWLYDLSEKKEPKKMDVDSFFNNQASLFDSIKDKNVAKAYSAMQYMEAYYLVSESVKRGLDKGQSKINIAFVLPNDEGKYYQDLPNDIKEMLRTDFGERINGIEVDISFNFFLYGSSLEDRPYIDKQPKALKVKPNEITSYFGFLRG